MSDRRKFYCNVMARERGLDPVGYAGTFDDAVLIETPKPWKRDVFGQEGALPKEAIALRAAWLKAYQETGRFPHRPLLIAPNKKNSVEGKRRVMFYERPSGSFAQFTKAEYLVTEELIGPLVYALHEDKPAVAQYEEFRVVGGEHIRDLLVCTHAAVDVACAKFGFPIFNYLQKTYDDPQVRFWEVTHFGGHAFAPTMMDMPLGHYWAFVGREEVDKIVTRSSSPTELRGHYRGWAGIPGGFVQAAERELWQRFGWEWFGYNKTHRILAQDEENEKSLWATVEFDFSPNDEKPTRVFRTHVTLGEPVETISATESEKVYPYRQYVVSELEEIVPSLQI